MSNKRGRACEACNKIKIKCELGSTTGLDPPCERCLRLNKHCVLSQPKRQKDRVAELEAQVAALTQLLKAQGIQDPNVVDSPVRSETVDASTPERAQNKRRRVDDVSTSSGPSDSPMESTAASNNEQDLSLVTLDTLVDYELQQQVLSRYLDKQFTALPLVPISGDSSLASLRSDRPVLFYAIMYAAGPGLLSLEQQEAIAKVLLDHLTNIHFSPEPQALATIQAVQITCLFYRSPRHHVHLSVFGLIEVGVQSVTKLGHGGPLSAPPTTPYSSATNVDVDSLDAWRAILVSQLLASAMAIFMRRKPAVKWTKEHDMCLLQLQYSAISKPTDPWLSQLLRAEHVCEQIAEQMEFWNTTSYMDLSDTVMRSKVQTCRNLILNWRLSIPAHIRTPTLLFWEHLATAYMHEAVLHTATNKQSFAAPFVAENLSVSDFPAPIVTQDHVTALFELTTAAHAMIDLYSSLDTETMVAMPGFLHSSRAAYALFILAKLFIATMAPGNTLGSVLDGNMTLVGNYADKLIENGRRVRALDERCAPSRILFAAVGIKEWYQNFIANICTSTIPYAGQNQEPNVPYIAASTTDIAPAIEVSSSGTDLDFAAAQSAVDWENFFYYSSNTADFGLDMLFDEEPQPFRGETFT